MELKNSLSSSNFVPYEVDFPNFGDKYARFNALVKAAQLRRSF